MWMLVFILVTANGGITQSNFHGFYDEYSCHQFGSRLAEAFDSPEQDSFKYLSDIEAIWKCFEAPSTLRSEEGFVIRP